MITTNQPFSGWDAIFADRAMTVAAIDRLVHHATIFEMNVESYRRRAAHAAATSLSGIAGDAQKPRPKKEQNPVQDTTSTATSEKRSRTDLPGPERHWHVTVIHLRCR